MSEERQRGCCKDCHWWRADESPKGLGACCKDGFSLSTTDTMTCDRFTRKVQDRSIEEIQGALNQITEEIERASREVHSQDAMYPAYMEARRRLPQLFKVERQIKAVLAQKEENGGANV